MAEDIGAWVAIAWQASMVLGVLVSVAIQVIKVALNDPAAGG